MLKQIQVDWERSGRNVAASMTVDKVNWLLAEVNRMQSIFDNLPRQPNGEYLQCPLCGQYLDADGTCPEGCGNIGQWLANYAKAQKLIDIIAKLPKCWRLVNGQLVQDVLIVAGMTAWYLTALAPQGIRESAVRSYECRIDGWWVWFTEQNYRRPEDCYSSRESAETAIPKEATP